MMVLPTFRYHPDPLATGAIEASDMTCECCGQARGYLYASNIYGKEDIEHVCPWCIADGSVHKKFDAVFASPYPLEQAGLPQSVIDEVSQRTPGYVSWQGEWWLCCCGDACEFHGDAPRKELLDLDEIGLAQFAEEFPADNLAEIIEYYRPGGSPAFYKFVCRHCGKFRYHVDRC